LGGAARIWSSSVSVIPNFFATNLLSVHISSGWQGGELMRPSDCYIVM
jgi:hypothetical protein